MQPVTKAELIRFLEPFTDDVRILTYSATDPDPGSIESAEYAAVDDRGTVLLKLSSVRVGWDYPEEKKR